jgi:hypothetical protein
VLQEADFGIPLPDQQNSSYGAPAPGCDAHSLGTAPYAPAMYLA